MCAIAGVFFTPKAFLAAKKMADRMVYRGPDDGGVYAVKEMQGALSHRRLAILDLSPHGKQPWISSCQSYSFVYNGELYNYPNIKAELESKGIHFKGHSDTEVFFHALLNWGVTKSLQKIRGMFAFAFVDHQHKKIYLGRDSFGEKPLYYAWNQGAFLFASDLQGMRSYEEGEALSLDPQAVGSFLRYGYIPHPFTIYKNVRKVCPGAYLEVTSSSFKETTYFKSQDIALKAFHSPYKGSFQEAVEDIQKDLSQSIKSRTFADVPLGCFLSGGIDSSLIATLWQRESRIPLKTFTIGFQDPSYNEAPSAKKIAEFLGTDHTELYITEKEARDVIPSLPSLYGEPFGDSSQIPTFLVSHLARQHVKVCLSGDGGDEIFGGYNRYIFAQTYLPFLQKMPSFLTFLLKRIYQKLNTQTFFCGKGKSAKLFNILDHIDNLDKLYQTIVSSLPEMSSFLTFQEQDIFKGIYNKNLSPPFAMMLADVLSYLPGDILTKVDRASMGVGLEVRSPYLDPLLFEKSYSFPLIYHIQRGKGKRLLRAILEKHIPSSLIESPKAGFSLPLGNWMRGALRDWCETLLSFPSLKESGFFHEKKIQEIWREHLQGKKDYSSFLWNVIVFQQWFQQR